MLNFVVGVLRESFLLAAQMAPYLLLGMGVAGLLHVLVPERLVAQHLGGKGWWPVLKASLLGVPLPLCSCGVVPVAASIKDRGASRGAVLSFLTSTPTSGVDSMLASWSLLGPLFAIVRPVVSFVLGVVSGVLAELFGGPEPDRGSGSASAEAPTAGAVGRSLPGALRRSFSYGFGELAGGMAFTLLIGILIGGLLSHLLPHNVLAKYLGQGWLSYLVMLVVGVPLYVCASGSIPVAAALMLKGLSPGAALVFLIVGPATNSATVAVVGGMLGRRALTVYLAVISLGALGAGYLMDLLVGAWPGLAAGVRAQTGGHQMGVTWSQVVWGSVLGGLLLYHLLPKITRRLRRKGAPPAGGGGSNAKILVPDMRCGHCAGTIEDALAKVSGVRRVEVDIAGKMVTVELDRDQQVGPAMDAISTAGYHPEEVDNEPACNGASPGCQCG